MDTHSHWEEVYATKRPELLSWHCQHLTISLDLIKHLASSLSASIIDVGGGASTLVDDLLLLGYENLTVVDISETALKISRRRLDMKAGCVHWLVADILDTKLEPNAYEIWHDRAVFHLLTQPEDRAKYLRQAVRAIKPGGHLLVGTYGPAGPPICAGLDVKRYDEKTLRDEFGKQFELIEGCRELYHSPETVTQEFLYCGFRRV